MIDTKFLAACYDVAIEAARVEKNLTDLMPSPPKGRLIVVGAGKGSAQLAQAFERLYNGPLEGVVVTRYGFGAECSRIKIIEAAHPIPDGNSRIAALELQNAVTNLAEDDLVVALITGGGSALLSSPLAPITLEDEISLTKILLASGLPIGQMNTIRRHTSQIKNGGLARIAAPAKVLTYLVSDVPGDDPAEIASGPTIAGKTLPSDAMRIIIQNALPVPDNVYQALEKADQGRLTCDGEYHILASAGQSLSAVQRFAEGEGLSVEYLGDNIEGEARQVARDHAKLVRKLRTQGWRGLILSGGETTVKLRGNGRGGRNTEYLLSLAIELDGIENVAMFAADTDGVDGSENNAGAFADSGTAQRLAAKGLSPQGFLENNDAYSAFEALGDLFVPGPSGTNVNDLRIIWLQ